MKRLALLLLVAFHWAIPASAEEAQAAAVPAVELDKFWFNNIDKLVQTSLQCLGGYKFLVVASTQHPGANSASTAVSVIQVQEYVSGGKVVRPSRC